MVMPSNGWGGAGSSGSADKTCRGGNNTDKADEVAKAAVPDRELQFPEGYSPCHGLCTCERKK